MMKVSNYDVRRVSPVGLFRAGCNNAISSLEDRSNNFGRLRLAEASLNGDCRPVSLRRRDVVLAAESVAPLFWASNNHENHF